ncbi:preprotein translocase subunit SecG [Oceanidesulfovibrio indonesiensis]|uniref:preprotein translocase subunit SecG n=1 Tax=Oceanidesulfovibrio indonesiensis TaxID=54767 RepID=UPI003F673AA6
MALHIVACLVLVAVVLLQSGKEGMGVIFGGGSSSLFGSSGAGGLLAKVTAAVAAIFLMTSLGYNIITSPTTVEKSVMDEAPQSQPLSFEEMGANATNGQEEDTVQDETETPAAEQASETDEQQGDFFEEPTAPEAAPAETSTNGENATQ